MTWIMRGPGGKAPPKELIAPAPEPLRLGSYDREIRELKHRITELEQRQGAQGDLKKQLMTYLEYFLTDLLEMQKMNAQSVILRNAWRPRAKALLERIAERTER